MAKRRCAYCGQREGHGHPVRCGVTRHGLDPCYEEDPADVTAERDRYKAALNYIAFSGTAGPVTECVAADALDLDQPWTLAAATNQTDQTGGGS